MIVRDVCYFATGELEGLVIVQTPPGFQWGPMERGEMVSEMGIRLAVKTIEVDEEPGDFAEAVSLRKRQMVAGGGGVKESDKKHHIKKAEMKHPESVLVDAYGRPFNG